MNREMPPPNIHVFLADFLNDLAYLNEQGIEVDGAKFVIEHFETYVQYVMPQLDHPLTLISTSVDICQHFIFVF